MKTIFLSALMIIASVALNPTRSWANPERATICRTIEDVADAGYDFWISADEHTAQLTEQTIGGPRKVSDMLCQRLHQRACPDCISNYLVCHERRGTKHDLIVRVYAGGIAGLHYASVRKQYLLNRSYREVEIRFGHLICNR